ncbi:Follistatin-related protein 5 [Takifugu flavidus]|uniref:Follistatin-related protein 5 n=1 Tax=Takifugu flavidus TaxID=433684 RepID=A0A5C6ML99_9TELE|nr:Follistatin-related protein 5 [Takifugu flavidus]
MFLTDALFHNTVLIIFHCHHLVQAAPLDIADDNCRLTDYRQLKTKILDLYDKRYTGSNARGAHKDNMAARKQLVDDMFKHFDADNSGRVDDNELSQVIKQEGLFKDVSECTLFDLLKYNDVNDDEHLTKEEFYTAFAIGEAINQPSIVSPDVKLTSTCYTGCV